MESTISTDTIANRNKLYLYRIVASHSSGIHHKGEVPLDKSSTDNTPNLSNSLFRAYFGIIVSLETKGEINHVIPNQCTFRHVIINPAEIHFLRFLLEGYDGIGSITTIDAGLGLVRINIASGCEEEITRILQAEEERLQVREVAVAETDIV